MRISLNNSWYFTPNYDDNLPCLKKSELKGMEEVRLPHSVVETPFNYFDDKMYQMVSGYVMYFIPDDEWQDKDVYLIFHGAAHEAEVFLNGESLGKHSNGYTSFKFKLENLKYGEENCICVKLDSRESLNIPPFGNVIDYMTYGGLYREVELEIKNKKHLEDVFVYGDDKKNLHLEIEATTNVGELVVEVSNKEKTVCSKTFEFKKVIDIENLGVELWDNDHPNLYTVGVKLIADGELQDEFKVRTGFRSIDFKADGLYLNGKKVKIRGLNRHQCYPYIGYAAPKRMQVSDAEILKHELGVNSVRTSHYPQSHHFLAACDELGLLVFTEIPGWQHIGDEEWKKQAIINTEEMVKEYRNHPSIYMWGVRINESMDCDELYTETNKVAHTLDQTRPTAGVRCIKNSHLLEDVYTYNEFVHKGDNIGCEPKKNVTSDMKKGYLVTENNGHMFPTKSFDWEKKRGEHALRHARVLNDVNSYDDIAGEYSWCMFDYNTHKDFGSGDRICYHGVMDMFRNPKLASYVYKAEGIKEPFIEVSSAMDIGEHPACALSDIYAYTNCDEIKLYKNDRYVRSFKGNKDFSSLKHPPIAIDDIIGGLMEEDKGYSHQVSEDIKALLFGFMKYGSDLPTSLKAKAAKLVAINHMKPSDANALFNEYINNWGGNLTTWRFDALRNNEVVASKTKGAVTAIHLEVKCDTTTLVEDETYDVASLRIRAIDQNGNVCTYLNRSVTLECAGPIAIVGPKSVPLMGGMCGTYIKSLGQEGKATLKILMDYQESIEIEFEVVLK